MIGDLNHRIKYLRGNDEFPPLSESRSNGLLAAGGSLSVSRLLKAYSSGIFPWYDEWSPILWYSPPERCIVTPSAMIRTKSLRQAIRNKGFRVSFDTDFLSVIKSCAQVERSIGDGTWIVPEMISAYKRLHEEGYAHSVEIWKEDMLVGGLYGVSLGKAFFGESMFHRESDASKVALHYLCKLLEQLHFFFIDAQMKTTHLLSLGAILISRDEYMLMLNKALTYETIRGAWTNLLQNE